MSTDAQILWELRISGWDRLPNCPFRRLSQRASLSPPPQSLDLWSSPHSGLQGLFHGTAQAVQSSVPSVEPWSTTGQPEGKSLLTGKLGVLHNR